ncbi:DHHA1 domain-containing protein [Colwelliaceae bacterium MEBiC 14330]
MHFDVFNGDADGIVALLQLRLAKPKKSVLVTGVKRDIALLKQVDVSLATSVTVLDISLEKNIDALLPILDNKIDTFYVDHHRSGEIPSSSYLKALINTDANTCTSLLVNDYLEGQFVLWAIVAAFGDNMKAAALTLAKAQGLTVEQISNLEALGIYINYNGYGEKLADLHFPPAQLYKILLNYADPLALIAEQDSVFYQLESAYKEDMHNAQSANVLADNETIAVYSLADEAWARRVSGVFGNDLANKSPDKAHAVLTLNADKTYTVSVRAPLNNKQGAGDICSQFPTGGGRAAAAGINKLKQADVSRFIETLHNYYL